MHATLTLNQRLRTMTVEMFLKKTKLGNFMTLWPFPNLAQAT